MGVVLGSFVIFAAFIAVTVIWGMRRFASVGGHRGIAPSSVVELGRIDLAVAQAVPALQGAVTDLNVRRMRKESGRDELAGVVVFGPRRLTWAPDDRTRGWGARPWQMPWDQVATVTVRQPAPDVSAVTEVALVDGSLFEIRGLDAERVRTGVRRHHPAAARD